MEPGYTEHGSLGTSALVQVDCSHIPVATAPLGDSFGLILRDPECRGGWVRAIFSVLHGRVLLDSLVQVGLGR